MLRIDGKETVCKVSTQVQTEHQVEVMELVRVWVEPAGLAEEGDGKCERKSQEGHQGL